jgi:hypothetical protein
MPIVSGTYGNQNFNTGTLTNPFTGQVQTPYGLPPGLNVFDAQKMGWTVDLATGQWSPPSTPSTQNPFKGPYASQMGTVLTGGASPVGGTSLATGGFFSYGGDGGQFSANAQLGQLRDEFRRMRERSAGALNEDLAARGIFSSGVGSRLGSEQRTALDLQEAAAIERIMNDLISRQQAFDIEKQRLALSRLSGGGGAAQRFGRANENQKILELLKALGGGGEGANDSSQTGGAGGTLGTAAALLGRLPPELLGQLIGPMSMPHPIGVSGPITGSLGTAASQLGLGVLGYLSGLF